MWPNGCIAGRITFQIITLWNQGVTAQAKLAALQRELEVGRRSDGRWRREVDIWEEMLKGLRAHSNKKLAMIAKLKEEINHLNHEILGREDLMKYLEGEVEVERQESSIAFEGARLARKNIQNLQAQLKEEVEVHEKLRKEAARVELEVK